MERNEEAAGLELRVDVLDDLFEGLEGWLRSWTMFESGEDRHLNVEDFNGGIIYSIAGPEACAGEYAMVPLLTFGEWVAGTAVKLGKDAKGNKMILQRFCLRWKSLCMTIYSTSLMSDGTRQLRRTERNLLGDLVTYQRDFGTGSAVLRAAIFHGSMDCTYCMARKQRCECSVAMRHRAATDLESVRRNSLRGGESSFESIMSMAFLMEEERFNLTAEYFYWGKDRSRWVNEHRVSCDMFCSYSEMKNSIGTRDEQVILMFFNEAMNRRRLPRSHIPDDHGAPPQAECPKEERVESSKSSPVPSESKKVSRSLSDTDAVLFVPDLYNGSICLQNCVLPTMNLQSSHQCAECDATFPTCSRLKRHVLGVHRQVRNFKCTQCPRMFSQKSHLSKHCLDVHEQRRDHKCPDCDKYFSSPYKVKRHMVVHQGANARCPICGVLISEVSSLRRHIRRLHSK